MIPILYDTNETSFTSNGLGRLRDCIECKVTEERNGVYEADFQYPVTGANFDRIKVGRIIGVTHNESEDIQPFDIVSYEKPINGIVTFHCTHISYRQSYMTVTGSNINSLADAFTLLGTAEPTNPFTYQTDKTSSAYMSGADGKPKSVRSLLGGTEGSILDTYGGEYEWDKFKVILHDSRGETRPFSIRYGVNMLEYNEDFDTQGSYSSCIPFWSNGTETVVGDRQFATGVTIANRGECVPLDVSDKFESKPTKAEVEAMGVSVMASKNVYNPTQTLHVEFARLQDVPDYENFRRLYQCNICDTINVVFPDYKSTGQFKIVKTVWDVLKDRYDSMELGDLSISLSQALGISNSYSGSAGGGGGGGEQTIHTPFTPTSGTSYANYGGCYYETYGNLVHVHVGVYQLTANTATIIYTLPSEVRPSTVIFAHGTGGAWNNIGYVEVRANGEIYVRAQSTGCGADAFYLLQ